MATTTLESAEELVVGLNAPREHWSQLLERTAEAIRDERQQAARNLEFPPTVFLMHTEALELIASGPTPEEIRDYMVSQPLQDRVEDLLDKNSEEGLTSNERAEMDVYLQTSHHMTMLKAGAHEALRKSST